MRKNLLALLIGMMCMVLVAWPAFAERQCIGCTVTTVATATSATTAGTANIANTLADPATAGWVAMSKGMEITNTAIVTNSAPQFKIGNTGMWNIAGGLALGQTQLNDYFYIENGTVATSMYLTGSAAGAASIRSDGSAAGSPTYSFRSDVNTGLHWLSADDFQLVSGGAAKVDVASTMISFYNSMGPYAQIGNHSDAGWTQAAGSIGVSYANIGAANSAATINSPSVAVNSTATEFTVTYGGVYRVHLTASSKGGAGVELHTCIGKNGVCQNAQGCEVHARYDSANDIAPMHASCLLNLAANDRISAQVESTGGASVTMYTWTLVLGR